MAEHQLCTAVLMIKGEYFRCDWPTDEQGQHPGWNHANGPAAAVWCDPPSTEHPAPPDPSTEQQVPLLGLATTRELLAELTSRIEVDGVNGGGGLDYSTAKGRPTVKGTVTYNPRDPEGLCR